MERVCGTCRHYREAEHRARDGEIIMIGYCKAIRTYPYRVRNYTCKRWHYDEAKALEG